MLDASAALKTADFRPMRLWPNCRQYRNKYRSGSRQTSVSRADRAPRGKNPLATLLYPNLGVPLVRRLQNSAHKSGRSCHPLEEHEAIDILE